MLIHRCYVVWGSRKIVLYPIGFAACVLNSLYLATAIAGSIGLNDHNKRREYATVASIDRGNSVAIAVFNTLLSLFTGGRIWWISREARQHMGTPVHARYRAIVAAIVESGLLYPTIGIISVVIPLVLDPDTHGTLPIDLVPVAALMSGLAPTLIIVRVAYGKSVESVQQVMESIHFAEQVSQQGPRHGTSGLRATVDIRSHHRSTDLEACENPTQSGDNTDEAQKNSKLECPSDTRVL
ncbi:hypothetical protein PM082_016666 [Marasmius tenuissimus]|nr:hypothetical protein PM082_016666 [Marasmius tenuissimus]